MPTCKISYFGIESNTDCIYMYISCLESNSLNSTLVGCAYDASKNRAIGSIRYLVSIQLSLVHSYISWKRKHVVWYSGVVPSLEN